MDSMFTNDKECCSYDRSPLGKVTGYHRFSELAGGVLYRGGKMKNKIETFNKSLPPYFH